jgi:hypothetical protein
VRKADDGPKCRGSPSTYRMDDHERDRRLCCLCCEQGIVREVS